MRNPVTLHRIQEMHADGDRLAMLTCYDATFACMLDAAGIDCLLVGGSLGEVLQGQPSTLPVSLEYMAYHTQCVARSNHTAWIVGDLPFGSYQESKDQALHIAIALMQAGAQKLKLEGGGWTTETVRFLVERGIPVCAHLGLMPRSVHAPGGCRIQGRTETAAVILKLQAQESVSAGAAMLVLELVPADLAREVTAALPIPVIGIDAGVSCSGQVLGLHDMLNIAAAKLLRFVRNFMDGRVLVQATVQRYVEDVKALRFPSDVLNGY